MTEEAVDYLIRERDNLTYLDQVDWDESSFEYDEETDSGAVTGYVEIRGGKEEYKASACYCLDEIQIDYETVEFVRFVGEGEI